LNIYTAQILWERKLNCTECGRTFNFEYMLLTSWLNDWLSVWSRNSWQLYQYNWLDDQTLILDGEWCSLFDCVKTEFMFHPASYLVGSRGPFLWNKVARACRWLWTTPFPNTFNMCVFLGRKVLKTHKWSGLEFLESLK
jgi:hypothetical protein